MEWEADKLTPLAAITGKVTENVAATLGIPFREAASRLGSLGLALLALRHWAWRSPAHCRHPPHALNWVGAEMGLIFESHLIELILHHLPRLNVQADHLSCPDLGGVPQGLENIE